MLTLTKLTLLLFSITKEPPDPEEKEFELIMKISEKNELKIWFKYTPPPFWASESNEISFVTNTWIGQLKM